MGSSEFGTGKSIIVLAIVVGCFAILWPKIFYPMMQAAFAITSPGDGEEQSFRPRDRPPHLQPGMLNSNLRKTAEDGRFIKDGKPFPHPSSRQPLKPQAKTGGAMSIIMPIYTIGIVVFFLYTVLKLVFKKPAENEKKPLIKDFHMDPNYHKFVCQQPPRDKKSRQVPNAAATAAKDIIPEEPQEETATAAASANTEEKSENYDEKDYEIYKLRRKLEETEIAMQRIMKHMGKVSDCLTNACLLKEGASLTTGIKEVAKERKHSHSYGEPRLITTKPTLRINRRKKTKAFDSADVINYASTLLNEEIAEIKNLTKPASVPNKVEDIAENTPHQLKRDSSLNSDNSSFELLSQGVSNSSMAADVSDLESIDAKDIDGSRSSDIADNISFEAVDEKFDADEECESDAECRSIDEEENNIDTLESKLDKKNS